MKKQRLNANYIDTFVVMGVGIAIILLIPSQIKTYEGMQSGIASPTLFPNIVGWALITLSIFRLLTVKFKDKKQELKITKDQFKKFLYRFGVVVLYLVCIPYLGFIISTILTLFVLIKMLGKTVWYKALLLSVATSLIVFISFREFLNIVLPYGFLGI